MTSSDSDDDREADDPSLLSMRAVWLSMRDEEPPSSGLAELMAAARAKAVEMQPKEPWWRRALASLRRPPVLALATVVVLLGGAVLISSRRAAMDAMPSADQADLAPNRTPASPPSAAAKLEGEGVAAAPPPELAKDSPAPVVADPAPTGAAAGSASNGAVAAPADGAQLGGVRERNLKTPAAARPSATVGAAAGPGGPASVAQPTMPGGAPETKNEGALVQEQPAVAPPLPPPPSSVPTVTPGRRPDVAGAPASSTLDHGAAGDKVKSPPPAVTVTAPTTPPKSATRPSQKQDLQIAGDADASVSEVQATSAGQPGKSFGAADERGGSTAVRGPTVNQLAKQAETAAARGDCAAVRAIVGRIKQLDAAFHKAHVAPNAAVKRCVK